MSSIFGAIVSPWTVEQAVLATVRTWIENYLAEIERQAELTVGELPRPESFTGGMDFLSYQQDQTPAIIAICQPFGGPELTGSGDYNQTFEIHLGCVVIAPSEDASREAAMHYAAALAALGVQQPSWGGISDRTRMTAAPTVEFVDPEVRQAIVGHVTFQSFVQQVVSESAGPDVPIPTQSPHYGGTPDAPWTGWPTVSTTSVTVSGQALT